MPMTNATRIETGTLVSVEVCPLGYHVAFRSRKVNQRWEHDVSTADVVNLVARNDPDHVQVQLTTRTLELCHALRDLPLEEPVGVFWGHLSLFDCKLQ